MSLSKVRVLVVTLLMAMAVVPSVGMNAISATNVSTFDDGSSVKVYDPGEPPEVTLPAGVVILGASLDIEGRAFPYGTEVLLNYNDTETEGWYGTSAEDPPTSPPSSFRGPGLSATNKTSLQDEDGDFMRSLAAPATGAGPYHHFSFNITQDPANIEKIKVHWKGRSEEPMVDMAERFMADLYVWNDALSTWVNMASYGWTSDSSLRVLEANITQDFDDYIDGSDAFHVLARGWTRGTFACYLDTDFVEVAVYFPGGDPDVIDPVLTLEEGGDAVWSHSGLLSTKVTLGDDILKDPIQAMSDEAEGQGESTFTMVLDVTYTGMGSVILSNLSIDHGKPPRTSATVMEGSVDEDASEDGTLDVGDLFTDDEAVEDLTFEVTFNEHPDNLSLSFPGGGGVLHFIPIKANWYGTVQAGIRVTDMDGLFVDYDQVFITVEPVNDPPVVLGTGIPDQTGSEDMDCPADLVDLWAYFEDGGWMEDDVAEMTFFLPPDKNPKVTDGTAVGLITGGRYFSCRPAADFNGPVEFVVEARDTGSASVTDTFTVDFAPVNDDPVFKSTPAPNLVEHGQYEYPIVVEDIDGDDIVLALEERPADNMTIEDGRLRWLPGDRDVGEHDVSISASDGESTVYQNFTVMVRNVNDPPSIEDPGPQTAYVGEVFDLTITAEDLDLGLPIDPPEELTFSDDSTLFDIDMENGTISFVPLWTQTGTHHAKVTVVDRIGETDVLDLEILVTYEKGTQAPYVDIVSPENGSKVKVKKAVTFKADVVDAWSGDWNLTWYIDGEKAGHGEELDLTFKKKGDHTVKVVASDGNGQVEDTLSVKAKPTGSQGSPGFEGSLSVAALVLVIVLSIVRGRRKREEC